MKGLRIVLITLASVGIFNLADAQYVQNNNASASTSAGEVYQDTSSMAKTNNELTVQDLKELPGDVKIEFEKDGRAYKYVKKNGVVKEAFDSPMASSKIKKDKGNKNQKYDYQYNGKEYKYKENDSKTKEKYKDPDKEWEIKNKK